jgi:hypothetical protein
MRKTLSIFLLCASTISFACQCHPPGIKLGYKHSSIIFYGKYLSTDTTKVFHNFFGQPIVVDNFEVIKFYRGVDSSTFQYFKNTTDPYIISIISNCHFLCGLCFEKDKKYLVYSNPAWCSGFLELPDCSRTRQIINDDFRVDDSSLYPDKGKDEELELKKLELADTVHQLSDCPNDMKAMKGLFNDQLQEAKQELDKRTTLIYIIVSFAALLVIIILYLLKRNASN